MSNLSRKQKKEAHKRAQNSNPNIAMVLQDLSPRPSFHHRPSGLKCVWRLPKAQRGLAPFVRCAILRPLAVHPNLLSKGKMGITITTS